MAASERDDGLRTYTLPRATVRPLLSALQLANGMVDALFYDVGVLYRELAADGYAVVTATPREGRAGDAARSCGEAIKTHLVNFGALADPEGVILVIDARHAPYVTRYADVRVFLARETGIVTTDARRRVSTVTITGVGSSALGAAAFAWNVSSALDAPVAAIVPGYGLADIVPQALGGWFGFEVQDFLRRIGQSWMEFAAPQLAGAGRTLSDSAPRSRHRPSASTAPSFRPGCPESDILHAILLAAPEVTRVVGHSKGALGIENALRDLPAGRAEHIEVITFGCAIAEETGAVYKQILGSLDGFGQLNSWGNAPERWITASHTTNTLLPLPMPVAKLTKEIGTARGSKAATRNKVEPAAG